MARFDAVLVSLDALRVTRDARMIRQDPGEHLFVLFQLEGQCRITQHDRHMRLSRGDIFLADSTAPSEFGYSGRLSRQLSLHIPRDDALRRFGSGCAGGVGISRDDPLFPAMLGVLAALTRTEGTAALPLGEAFLSILEGYFHGTPQGKPACPSGSLYQAALRQIARRAFEPDFDLDGLATDMGVSRRTVQRLFERNGDTFSGRVLALRLDRAWARLKDEKSGASIADVAYDCGFNDLSHFYRVFRAQFGQAPGRLRRIGR